MVIPDPDVVMRDFAETAERADGVPVVIEYDDVHFFTCYAASCSPVFDTC
jgi:hypothetical protein